MGTDTLNFTYARDSKNLEGHTHGQPLILENCTISGTKLRYKLRT